MREEGSAMLTSVIIIMVLLLISGVFFTLISTQAKVETSEEKALKAYYLAEAGINYEIAAVLTAEENNQSSPKQNLVIDANQFPQGQVQNPFGAPYGGAFDVQWSDDGNSYTFTVSSTGIYQNVQRKLQEQYKYKYSLPTP